jgi:hypothetical protein
MVCSPYVPHQGARPSNHTYETQVAASDGKCPLRGTMLLNGHRPDSNYAAKTVELT